VKLILTTLAIALVLPALAHAEGKAVTVSASYLNIRGEDGSILCTVPHGTEAMALERHADGTRVKVRLDHPPEGCPRVGLVNENYLDLDAKNNDNTEWATADVDHLSLRSAPKLGRSDFLCTMSKGTRLKVIDENFALSDQTPWIKVAVDPPQKGCPSEGYVFHSYLRGVNPFIDLPMMKGSLEQESEDVADCCDRPDTHPGTAIERMHKVSKQISQRLPEGGRSVRVPEVQVSRRLPGSRAAVKFGVWPSGILSKMVAAFHRAASKYRNYAPHVCTRMGAHYPCGGSSDFHRSKGWCKSGVREAIQEALGKTITGSSATESQAWLQRNMTYLAGVSSCKDAPIGAICLYDRRPAHNFGHIEGKTGENEYCSDFCANHPIRVGRFVGAYMPSTQ
jgi:hypothetical protein